MKTQKPKQEMITAAELAARCGVSRVWILSLAKNGRLPFTQFGPAKAFPAAEAMAAFQGRPLKHKPHRPRTRPQEPTSGQESAPAIEAEVCP